MVTYLSKETAANVKIYLEKKSLKISFNNHVRQHFVDILDKEQVVVIGLWIEGKFILDGDNFDAITNRLMNYDKRFKITPDISSSNSNINKNNDNTIKNNNTDATNDNSSSSYESNNSNTSSQQNNAAIESSNKISIEKQSPSTDENIIAGLKSELNNAKMKIEKSESEYNHTISEQTKKQTLLENQLNESKVAASMDITESNKLNNLLKSSNSILVENEKIWKESEEMYINTALYYQTLQAEHKKAKVSTDIEMDGKNVEIDMLKISQVLSREENTAIISNLNSEINILITNINNIDEFYKDQIANNLIICNKNQEEVNSLNNLLNIARDNLRKATESIDVLKIDRITAAVANQKNVEEEAKVQHKKSKRNSFIKGVIYTDTRNMLQQRWEKCLEVLRDRFTFSSTLYDTEHENTWKKKGDNYVIFDIALYQQGFENCNKEMLEKMVRNRSNPFNVLALLKKVKNVSFVSGCSHYDERIEKNNVILLNRIEEDVENSVEKKLTFIPFLPTEERIVKITNILKSTLEIGMNQNGFYFPEDDNNDEFNDDKYHEYHMDRTCIGFRSFRSQVTLGNVLTDEGFRVSVWQSDSTSPPQQPAFRVNLKDFLRKSNCYDTAQIDFDQIQKRTFNLIFVFSSDGEKLCQICLPTLEWTKTMNSASCVGYDITNKILETILPWIKVEDEEVDKEE